MTVYPLPQYLSPKSQRVISHLLQWSYFLWGKELWFSTSTPLQYKRHCHWGRGNPSADWNENASFVFFSKWRNACLAFKNCPVKEKITNNLVKNNFHIDLKHCIWHILHHVYPRLWTIVYWQSANVFAKLRWTSPKKLFQSFFLLRSVYSAPDHRSCHQFWVWFRFSSHHLQTFLLVILNFWLAIRLRFFTYFAIVWICLTQGLASLLWTSTPSGFQKVNMYP